MSTGAAAARVIHCPGCGGPSLYASSNEFRPFCSARCKNNDFGAWASESYSVDANAKLPEADAEARSPGETPPTH